MRALATLDAKLLRDLWRLKGQGAAICLVVACACAIIVVMLGTLTSLTISRDAYYERYRFADVFATATRAPLGLADRIAEIDGVKAMEARIAAFVLLDLPELAEPARARLLSLPEAGRPSLNDIVLRKGRLPDPNRPDEVVVNESFAEAHAMEPGASLAANIEGKRRTLRVVGVALSPEFVYTIGPGDLVPDERRFAIAWMGRRAMEAAFDLDGAFNDLVLSLYPGTSEQSVIERLDVLLRPYGGLGAYGRDDQISHTFLQGELDQLGTMATLLPPIFLAVAAFLLNVVMARVVATERSEIGLMKAFGYSNAGVAAHYLKLAVGICAIGVLLGWGTGIWLGRGMTGLYAQNYKFPFLFFRFEAWVFLVSGGVCIGACALGTLNAIRGAVRLTPAEAMRPPQPTGYHAGFIESLGAQRLMSQPNRMVVRHFFRWPIRSGLTVLGIASSCGLLVMSLFFSDSIDEMTDSFFFKNQRFSTALTFTEIQNREVLHDLASLPGVMRIEPVRFASVRLVNGPLSERTAITGLSADARLSQLIDTQGRPVEIAPGGLTLSDFLAKELGVSAGDWLRVEALEGRRRVEALRVSRVITENIGSAAYMDIAALNRFMGEGQVASAVRMVTDAHAEEALFAEFKTMPIVQGVASQRAAYTRFVELLDQIMGVTITVYVTFGSLIAVGIAYNSARISLAERSRELASMRVLGFTQTEAATVLLGELALVTVLALPIGCLMGYGLAALLVGAFESELYRIPLIIEPSTYGWAMVIVLASACATGLMVARRLSQLDLVAVMKVQE